MNLYTFFRTRLEHIRNARLSRAELEALQLLKFRRLVAYAERNSLYYRKLIASHGICIKTCVPSDFPILTKTELLTHFDSISTVPMVNRKSVAEFIETSQNAQELFQGKYTVLHTSGSSGEVGYLVYSFEDLARSMAHVLRFNPFSFKKQRMAFFGATGGHFTGESMVASSQWSPLRYLYEVASYSINSPIKTVIKELNAFKPEILVSYPTGLTMLAECKLRKELNITPRYIQCSGESLTVADRAKIEVAFGIPLINSYVSTEHLIMGYGITKGEGIYLMEDDLIFELKQNSTLVTNLFNYTLPLIRYRMTDVLEQIEDTKPIYPFIKIKENFGRYEQTPFFINQNGEEDFISPHILAALPSQNLLRYQLQIVDKTSCILRACLITGLDEVQRRLTLDELRKHLTEIFIEKQMANVRVDVYQIDELLPDTKTGKFHFIVFP